MHEIPETMSQAQTLAVQLHQPVSQVIHKGLQNWAQQLLDEGVEGGYLTAELTETGLNIYDIDHKLMLTVEALQTTSLTTRFEHEPHATMLAIQTQIRKLFDTGKLR